ncbi:MAG TPA: ATPase domain-containing protein [Longimicrobiaceae bacterium]|nr:ATPase domain-containing protein [Longimicrobiaceae bacterium]
MLSTGIEALDSRLGGLVEGRYYLVSGGPGTGKTSLALHFLGAAVEAGERCAILTQDDPEDLLAQGEFLGYELRAAAEGDRLAVLQYRLDFAHNYTRMADPGRVLEEMEQMLGEPSVSRIVIDTVVPFVDSQGAQDDATAALAAMMERLPGTKYLTVPGDVGDSHYWRMYDRVVTGAAGIFHLERGEGQARVLTLRKLRQTATSTDPLHFTLAAGMGVVEKVAAGAGWEAPAGLERRVVLLEAWGRLPEEAREALQGMFEVSAYDGVQPAFAELAGGRFGVLVVVLDPREPDAAFDLVRQLRKLGSGAPVLYVSPRQDLRATTRARGLRAGGDDFLTDELGAEEFAARVDLARARGHRPGAPLGGAENVILQPLDDAGSAVPIDEAELRRAVQHQVEHASHPFFALATVRPPAGELDDTWWLFSEQLRLREGDLVAKTEDGRVAVYLHGINRRHVTELMSRLVDSHPGLTGLSDVEVLCYPADRGEVEEWMARGPAMAR